MMKTRQDGKFSMFKIICHPSCDSRRGPWIILSGQDESRTPDLLERILYDHIGLNECRIGVGISLQIIRQQFSADRFDPIRELFFKRRIEPSLHGFRTA